MTLDKDNRKGEKNAIPVLTDELTGSVKYVKPLNLILFNDDKGNPYRIKDLIEDNVKLKAQVEALTTANDNLLAIVKQMNLNIELMKAEVM